MVGYSLILSSLAFSKEQCDVHSAIAEAIPEINFIGLVEKVGVKQHCPVFTIGYGDGVSVSKKITDFPTYRWGIFLVVVVQPVPVKGLLFSVDDKPAAVRR